MYKYEVCSQVVDEKGSARPALSENCQYVDIVKYNMTGPSNQGDE